MYEIKHISYLWYIGVHYQHMKRLPKLTSEACIYPLNITLNCGCWRIIIALHC